MGRWAARADNTRLKQMHPHWLKHLRGPEDVSILKMDSLLDATAPDQLALQVPSKSHHSCANQSALQAFAVCCLIMPTWRLVMSKQLLPCQIGSVGEHVEYDGNEWP